MQNNLVSLIIPIYNDELFLGECLDSVLNQTYKNLEIILVDDGSSDKSGTIADDYARKDTRIKVIHQENKGVSTARNVALDIVTGDYVCFSDADDILSTDYVDYLLNMALDNNVEIALTTEIYTSFYGVQTKNEKVYICSGEDAAAKIMYYHIPIGVLNKIFKYEFIKELRFFPDVYIGEGFNFNAMAFQLVDKVAIGNRRIYCYRKNNTTSAMTKFNIEKCKMATQAIDIMRDHLIIRSDKLYKACKFASWHTHGDMYNWMVRSNAKKDYPELYKDYYSIVKSYAFNAVFAPISKKERFRAILQTIHPKLLAYLLMGRRLLFLGSAK
jgi:glycosyltransferase involved in cell wall biosynthesis